MFDFEVDMIKVKAYFFN